MSTCLFCSTITSSSLFPEPNCRWPSTITPPIHFPLRKHVTRNSPWGIARVFQDEGVGVLFPDESVSLPEFDSDEGRDVDGGLVNGVAETLEEKEGTLGLSKDLVRGRFVKKREDEEEEDGYGSRFKLRNGKQVCCFERSCAIFRWFWFVQFLIEKFEGCVWIKRRLKLRSLVRIVVQKNDSRKIMVV